MNDYIDVHTHTCKGHISIVSLRFGVQCIEDDSCDISLGVHPWDVESYHNFEVLDENLQNISVIALGEVGLDYYKAKTEDQRLKQVDVFVNQVKLAEKFGLPLIIHSVKSNNEIISLLKKLNFSHKVVFHGFIGNSEEVKRIVGQGWYVSFSMRAMKSDKTLSAFRDVALNHVFCETDDTLDSIEDVYTAFSELRDENIETIKEIIYNNYIKVFKNG